MYYATTYQPKSKTFASQDDRFNSHFLQMHKTQDYFCQLRFNYHQFQIQVLWFYFIFWIYQITESHLRQESSRTVRYHLCIWLNDPKSLPLAPPIFRSLYEITFSPRRYTIISQNENQKRVMICLSKILILAINTYITPQVLIIVHSKEKEYNQNQLSQYIIITSIKILLTFTSWNNNASHSCIKTLTLWEYTPIHAPVQNQI